MKKNIWRKVQEVRSSQHVERVKKTLQRVIGGRTKKIKKLQAIASQLMTVRPGIRGELLKGLGLSFIDSQQVFSIIQAKKEKARRIIEEKRAGLEADAFSWKAWIREVPSFLKPIYRKLAKAREASGREALTPNEFFEILRQAAVERGKTIEQLFK